MSKEKYIPRLREKYNNEIINHFQINNKMRIPKISKISLNMGLGDAKENKNSLKQAIEELTNIAGQKAVVTRSKKAISNFKLREGDPVGVKVTLRGNNMYEFLDRLISITTPRIRDFRGFSSKGMSKFLIPASCNSFDGIPVVLICSSSITSVVDVIGSCFISSSWYLFFSLPMAFSPL